MERPRWSLPPRYADLVSPGKVEATDRRPMSKWLLQACSGWAPWRFPFSLLVLSDAFNEASAMRFLEVTFAFNLKS